MNFEQIEALILLGTIVLMVVTPIIIFVRVFRNAKNCKKLPKILD